MAQSEEHHAASISGLGPLSKLRLTAPTLFYSLVFLLLAELITALIVPLIIPDHIYLRWYMGKKSIASMKGLLADRHHGLIYDQLLGWRTRPNVVHENWRIDQLGSRATHAFGLTRTKPTRVLFLGNSLVNGGGTVSNDQTISALVEDANIEALNFATMLYSLDQVLLAYTSHLYRYHANVVVVGLSGELDTGLTNRFVPFRSKKESSISFLKPRFSLTNDGVKLLSLPSKAAYARMIDTPSLLVSLKTTDGHIGEFVAFKHFGLSPLLRGAHSLYQTFQLIKKRIIGDDTSIPLLLALMQRLERTARLHHASVIFMILPTARQTFIPWYYEMLPDHYAQLISILKRCGFTVLDTRPALRSSGLGIRQLFVEDDFHFASEGNRIIAAALKRVLKPEKSP